MTEEKNAKKTVAASKEMTDAQMDAEAKRWGKHYAAEEKVRIRIPPDQLNKEDDVVPVCINGYNYFVKRGVTVDVPKTVANILENAGYI